MFESYSLFGLPGRVAGTTTKGSKNIQRGTRHQSKQRVCVVGLFVFVFCGIFYLPLLVSLRPPTFLVFGDMSRDLKIYVRPDDNGTALIGPVPDAPTACPNRDFVLVVVVCSAVPNFGARKVIRETWGSPFTTNSRIVVTTTMTNNGTMTNETTITTTMTSSKKNSLSSDVRLVFLLGRSENDTLQDSVLEESEVYGDIIQEDFLDTYNNLTLKSVMLLKWVNTSCRRARFVMKTDDDMFVNIPLLVRHLVTGQTNAKGVKIPSSKLLLGSLICGAAPVKDRKSKWYAPNSMFDERVYPNYLSGTGYVMSRDVVPQLYRTALETPFFHMEDVFVTGICGRKLKLKPKDHVGFSYQKKSLKDPCLFERTISSHRMTPGDLRKIWADLQKLREGTLRNVTTSKIIRCDPKKRMKLRSYSPSHCK